jgi:hypothetical protein
MHDCNPTTYEMQRVDTTISGEWTGDVWKVIDYPKAGRILDNGVQLPDIGYKIVNVESEDLIIHYSDLRQHGWDILEKVES